MRPALTILSWATDLAFLALAGFSLYDWIRHRRQYRLDFALAVGLLAIVGVIGQVGQLLPHGETEPYWLSTLSLAGFLASGYMLLRFRSDFIPLGRLWHGVALGALAFTFVLILAVRLPTSAATHPTSAQQLAVALLVLVWAACVTEPIVQFVRASMHRPLVQRRRLRALAAGYLLLVIVLLVAGLVTSLAQNQVVALAISIAALLSVPLISIGFSPPNWMRRLWRESEAEAYRAATRDLLLYSPTRLELAQRAAEWAVRLTGGEGAVIADAGGQILATTGVGEGEARHLLETVPESEEPLDLHDGRTVARLPLVSPGRPPGALLLVGGPFTPLFGSDEIGVLRTYAVNTAAGLDRASLTERLSALERTKTEFLNLASHELRAPLTVLRGYLAMLQEGSLGDLAPQQSEVLPVLIQKADQMNRLVEQMLEASRLEEGRLELSIEPADLRELVRAAIDEVRPLADEAHPFNLAVPGDEVTVAVDRQRVTSIVTNLLSNAIKYSPRGGEVSCAIARDGQALVSVSDRGVGIAPEDMNSLFTRFGRVQTPETRNVPGTGLGLYLSRELARLHGGELTVSSKPGQGSTFTLRLPLAQS